MQKQQRRGLKKYGYLRELPPMERDGWLVSDPVFTAVELQ